MREIKDHILDGSNSLSFVDATSASTGEVFAKVAVSDPADIDKKLDQAHKLYLDRATWLPLHQRIEILEKAAEIMSAREEELAQEIALEGGKPLIDARVEASRAVQGVKKCIETISADQGTVIPMGAFAATQGRMAFTQKEPIGIVIAVSAFNHPLNLIVHQVGAAVAAGCPCIVKPSGDTPVSCINFVNILKEAGLPSEWLSVAIPSSRSESERLVTDERVGFFSFIGSGAVGWSLRSKLAPGVRCALEHGGSAPVILTENANLEKAIPALLKGGFYHAGQVCVSTQRLFVHESIARDVAEKLAAGASKLVVGDAGNADTEVGPLIRISEVDRVAEWVDEAISEGAEALCGGERKSERFYQPTVLFNPSTDSKVSQQEVFGPVVCVYSYSTLEEAISRANNVPFSFQAAVFSDDITEVTKVYKGINASAVMVNDHSAFREDGMPFAGLKSSGLGVGGIPHSIEDMQIEKMMVINAN